MTKIKADGHQWEVRLGKERPRRGQRVVLFFAQPTGQRPYRVVEVPETRFSSQEAVDRLSRDELLELYRSSTSMDIPKLRSDEIVDVRKTRRS